jgi:8-oxo-dGTP pyrophosphatase MutT (NUDIX family)
MHREPLLELLARYADLWPDEHGVAERFVRFVREHHDCLERTCVPGHITSSCWIVSPDGNHALLTHHRKLGRWLQLGGHVDGEIAVAESALREAREESGIAEFELVAWAKPVLVPLDLDVHTIPARKSDPEHQHWDVRFLLRVPFEQPLQLSEESNELRWVPLERLAELTDEESVLRLARKARALCR